jgi:hypothetical protein
VNDGLAGGKSGSCEPRIVIGLSPGTGPVPNETRVIELCVLGQWAFRERCSIGRATLPPGQYSYGTGDTVGCDM